MTHLASFMRSLPAEVALSRVPDQSLITGGEGKAARLNSDRVTASRAVDGKFAMFYVANGRSFQVRLEKLRAAAWSARWFNPRTGETTVLGRVAPAGEREFDPPGEPGDGNDWVLLLDAEPAAR
jgi:hypothetical protein